ncbi:hypothetical protein GCM10020256_73390 [Streptomyces thermocoprophilus]
MRSHNAGRPASRSASPASTAPLEITAAASPRQPLTALRSFLAARLDPGLLPCAADTLEQLLGADERWTEPAAMLDPARSVGRSADAGRLRLIADDLATLLDTHLPQLTATASPDEWDRARLYGRTATGLLRYHAAMADPSPSRMTRLIGLRDRMMADNLLALADRGPVLVHAHNSHLQRHLSSMAMWEGEVTWWSAGALTAARLGGQYAYVATALGTLRHQGVEHRRPAPSKACCTTFPRTAPCSTRGNWPPLSAPTVPRPASPWFGCAPLDPDRLEDSDALLFVSGRRGERPEVPRGLVRNLDRRPGRTGRRAGGRVSTARPGPDRHGRDRGPSTTSGAPAAPGPPAPAGRRSRTCSASRSSARRARRTCSVGAAEGLQRVSASSASSHIGPSSGASGTALKSPRTIARSYRATASARTSI